MSDDPMATARLIYGDDQKARIGLVTLLSPEEEERMRREMFEEPPLALTDQHVSALEKAIRAEGFDIFADPETGEIKLERVK